MDSRDLKPIKEYGNRLMADFQTTIRLFESVLSESMRDLANGGEEGIAAGKSKYEILEKIKEILPGLKEKYLFFSHLTGNDTGYVQWDFPFDETFRDVDIDMDNQVVDRFFDTNVRNVYLDVVKCRKKALYAMKSTINEAYFCCPCCDMAFFERNGDYSVCPVCGWENDRTQNNDMYYKGGANKECLSVARKNFLNFGKTMR